LQFVLGVHHHLATQSAGFIVFAIMLSHSVDHYKWLQYGLDHFKEQPKIDRAMLSLEDGDRRTLLHAASIVGNLDAVNWILKRIKTVDLKKKDKDGSTALHLAAQNGHLSTYDALLKAGSSPNLVDFNQLSPFYFLCQYVSTSFIGGYDGYICPLDRFAPR